MTKVKKYDIIDLSNEREVITMKNYKVYYLDGNIRMFSSTSLFDLMEYLVNEPIRGNENIIKIELRD